ncbi:MAG: type IV conjugative transfer system protein TraL [Nitrospirae bacterium]|nr:type IV conjugative transfer system protein TraL [Nitrospirota bacterium]
MALKVHPNIDKPITVLGLEPEEWAVLPATMGLVNLLTGSAVLAIVLSLASVVAIKRIKKGKPPGYLVHFLYRLGLPVKGWPRARRGDWRYNS